jgi:hypothetical protein
VYNYLILGFGIKPTYSPYHMSAIWYGSFFPFE